MFLAFVVFLWLKLFAFVSPRLQPELKTFIFLHFSSVKSHSSTQWKCAKSHNWSTRHAFCKDVLQVWLQLEWSEWMRESEKEDRAVSGSAAQSFCKQCQEAFEQRTNRQRTVRRTGLMTAGATYPLPCGDAPHCCVLKPFQTDVLSRVHFLPVLHRCWWQRSL